MNTRSVGPGALALRSEEASALLGYVPRYYCKGLFAILENQPEELLINVRSINPDAPLDMRLLCRLTAPWEYAIHLFELETDFQPWELEEAASLALAEMEKAAKALSDS